MYVRMSLKRGLSLGSYSVIIYIIPNVLGNGYKGKGVVQSVIHQWKWNYD